MVLFPSLSISVQRPRESVTHVTYGKRQNGGEGQMVQELFVMHVDCVSVCSLPPSVTPQTLCSHPRTTDYAKLMRKRDKAAGPDGKPPNIDLETLRASTRMAESSSRDATNRSGNAVGNNNSNGNQNAPADTKPPPSPPSQKSDSARPSPAVSKGGPPQSPISPATSNYHSNPTGPGVPPQPQPSHSTQMMPPSSIPSGANETTPPTWQGSRGYPAEHGSFMRAHAPPSHARGAPS